MSVRLYRPTADDLDELAAGLRPADRLELERETGSTEYRKIVQACVDQSPDSYAVIDAFGRVVALFGCAPVGALVSSIGAPWCLGTDQLDRQSRALMRISRRYIQNWRRTYPSLINFVDAENDLSIKFLAALGFHFDDPAPHGVKGMPFRRFYAEGLS